VAIFNVGFKADLRAAAADVGGRAREAGFKEHDKLRSTIAARLAKGSVDGGKLSAASDPAGAARFPSLLAAASERAAAPASVSLPAARQNMPVVADMDAALAHRLFDAGLGHVAPTLALFGVNSLAAARERTAAQLVAMHVSPSDADAVAKALALV
jgi:hypothetical protein